MIKLLTGCLAILALVGCSAVGDGNHSTQFIGHWMPVEGRSDSTYVKIYYNKVSSKEKKLLFYFADSERGTLYNLYPDLLSKGRLVFLNHLELSPSVDSAVLHDTKLIVYTSQERFEFQRR